MYTLEQLREKAPAVFRTAEEGAKHGASDKYKFIPTLDIIDDLNKFGWNIHDVAQQKSKQPETARHIVRFRHSMFSAPGIVGETIPEIILSNSHDRTKSMTFHVGLFRLVCSNGLVVADKTMAKLNLRHMGYEFEEVRTLINHATQSIPNAFETIKRFQAVDIDRSVAREFAIRALMVRYPQLSPNDLMATMNVENLLKVIRPEDAPNNLWTIFNRVQENIVNGRFIHVDDKKNVRAARKITDLELNIKVNENLWSLATEFCE